MLSLPITLRARVALAVLLGIFLVPVTTSSLRGLTHVLTCRAEVETTLVIDNTSSEDAVLGSADTITTDDPHDGLCGGLRVELQLAPSGADGEATVIVHIDNGTEVAWQGSVDLTFSGVSVPVSIGAIPAGDAATDTVTFAIDPDRSYEIAGTLLLGP